MDMGTGVVTVALLGVWAKFLITAFIPWFDQGRLMAGNGRRYPLIPHCTSRFKLSASHHRIDYHE